MDLPQSDSQGHQDNLRQVLERGCDAVTSMSDPLGSFVTAHERIRENLRSLEHSLDAALKRGRATSEDVALWRGFVSFAESFIESHFLREEQSLIPLLKMAEGGTYSSLASVISYDHLEVRRERRKLAEAIDELQGRLRGEHRGELEEVNRHATFTIQYLWLHLTKEEEFLFPPAKRALSDGRSKDISRE